MRSTSLIKTVNVPVVTAFGPEINTFTQDSSASGFASGEVGVLRATASANAASTPLAYFFIGGGDAQATDNNYQAAGQASADARFCDTLSVFGPVPNSK